MVTLVMAKIFLVCYCTMDDRVNLSHFLDFGKFSVFTVSGEIRTNARAQDFAEQVGLIPQNIICQFRRNPNEPICGGQMRRTPDREKKAGYRWRCPDCKKTVNPLLQTWFENTKLTFLEALQLTVLWFFRWPVTNAASQCYVSEHTAIEWYSFCREVCELVVANDKKPIGGFNAAGDRLTVELDESHLVKPMHHRGRLLEFPQHTWVFGGICRETGEIFCVRVPSRDRSTLFPIIHLWVERGSRVITDG